MREGEEIAVELTTAATSAPRSSSASVAPPPRHVAIIMDGNGRWARARGLPRIEGHRRGVDAVRATIRAAGEMGVEYLTLYAFSTENWRRPADEVSGLMRLFRVFMRREADRLVREGARVRFLGDPAPLPKDIQQMMDEIVERTKVNSRINVVVALNYGARAEIAAAARRLALEAARGEIDPASIDEETLERRLQTSEMPDPDLVIRTSGEQRLSNFLLWQAAYSELVYVPEAWPDFTPEVFARAMSAYHARDRRFGAVAS